MVINPFSVSLKIPVTRVTDYKQYKPDSEGVMHPVCYDIDRRDNVKIYVSAANRDIFCNLSGAAQSLLIWITFNLDSGCDYLVVDKKKYMNKCNVKSVNTFKGAVKELIRYAFISQSPDYSDVYWINPNYFFSGNPVHKYPDNVTVVAELSR